MKLIAKYIKLLLLLFSCSFLLSSFKHKRSNVQVNRMMGYNAFLCAIVDNTFELLEGGQKGFFFMCPSGDSTDGPKIALSLCEARRIILKIDKMRGWPDGGGDNIKKRGSGHSLLSQAIVDHSRALNEYWCYLEGADLGYSERENKLMEARSSILDGIRLQNVNQINKGAHMVGRYGIPTPLSFS